MAVKLALLLLVIALIVSVAMLGAFWYLKRRAEMKHEKEMLREQKRAELDEQLVEVAESESSIERELDKEKKR